MLGLGCGSADLCQRVSAFPRRKSVSGRSDSGHDPTFRDAPVPAIKLRLQQPRKRSFTRVATCLSFVVSGSSETEPFWKGATMGCVANETIAGS